MIRNSKVVRTVLVASAIMAMAGMPAVAATTGSLALSDTAPGILEITVTGVTGYTALELWKDVTDLKIADVVEKSNRYEGYTVVVQSSNAVANTAAPSLDSADTLEKLSYSLKYDGTAVVFTTGSSKITDAAAKTLKAGISKPMTISFSGADANLAEGTYTDTLTFTIAAK
jgi:hypothetical protein